jgi:mono/diheme cytochrome c family protein
MMRLSAIVFLVGLATTFAPPANKDRVRSAPQMYRRYCVSCHGTDGRAQTSKGKFNHARDLTDAKWHEEVTDERVFNSITNGRNVRGNMPAFNNKINQQEAESLVKFVRGLRG